MTSILIHCGLSLTSSDLTQILMKNLFTFFAFQGVKIVGHKRPALVDPSHSNSGSLLVHLRFTSGSLPVYFRFISGSLPAHLGPIRWSYEVSHNSIFQILQNLRTMRKKTLRVAESDNFLCNKILGGRFAIFLDPSSFLAKLKKRPLVFIS